MKFIAQGHRLTKRNTTSKDKGNLPLPLHSIIALLKSYLLQVLLPRTSCPPFKKKKKKIQGMLKDLKQKRKTQLEEIGQASEPE